MSIQNSLGGAGRPGVSLTPRALASWGRCKSGTAPASGSSDYRARGVTASPSPLSPRLVSSNGKMVHRAAKGNLAPVICTAHLPSSRSVVGAAPARSREGNQLSWTSEPSYRLRSGLWSPGFSRAVWPSPRPSRATKGIRAIGERLLECIQPISANRTNRHERRRSHR